MTKRILYSSIIIGISLLVLLSCARKMNPDIERGTNYDYQRGHPEVRVTALSTFAEQNDLQLSIIADIVYNSVNFNNLDEQWEANMTVELQIFDRDNDSIAHSKVFPFNHQTGNARLVESQKVFTLNRKLELKPGNYRIVFTLIDQSTSKQTTRTEFATVPDTASDQSVLTNVKMMGKDVDEDNKNWHPITTYDVQGKLDSLKFEFQTFKQDDNRLTLDTKLLKFETDTTYAYPMDQEYRNTLSMNEKGVDYDNYEIIQSNRRILSEGGYVAIEHYFSNLPRGNYRFTVEGETDNDQELYKARDFSIKSPSYPALQTPYELARPLIYLMNPKQYKKLLAINDRDSLKAAVDRFWLKNIGNRSRAKKTIELYYSRVQEANKLFSNFKEGWKTDRGMIYILFGPPWYEQKHHQKLSWSYTYDISDPNLNFSFRRVKVNSEFFPFDYYMLNRKNSYYTIVNRQKSLWLSGQILKRRI